MPPIDDMKTVGRYEIVREVGRGGMATVYLARQTDLDRFVALKELGAFHASDPSVARRFLRESQVVGSLSHPSIVTVYEYFEYGGTPYIAMEYVDRGSLRPYIGQMTLAQVGGVLEALLSALAHAEQQGIVHRDLKPENLLVGSDGRVKIADFGIAKATTRLQKEAFPTLGGTTVGTPAYMAPEQAMAQQIGAWTDLYSVGCMAFELFTGRVPFPESEDPMAIMLRHVTEQIPPLKEVEPSVDASISDWVEALLVKDPMRRTRSASEAWDAYEEIMLALLGPRWRREARLIDPGELPERPRPLTPAPFEASHGPPPAPYTPPPIDLPPGPITPPPAGVPGFKTYKPPGRLPAPPVESPPPAVAPPAPLAPAIAEPVAPPAAAPPARESEPVAAAGVAPARPVIATTVMPEALKDERAASAKIRRRARYRGLPIVAGAVVLVALLLGAVAGGSGDRSNGAPTVVVSNGALKLQVPRGWSRLATGPEVPGLSVSDAVALSPEGSPTGSAILFGQVKVAADNPALLPTALIEAIGGAPRPEAAVRLGPAGLEAYRYRGLRADGLDRRLTVYAVPTTAGVATVACVAPDRDFDTQCDGIANTLELLGGRSFPVGPSAEYADAVSGTLADLQRDAAAGRSRLARARTPDDQAAAAGRLARVYGTAARAVGALEPGPADRTANRLLVHALEVSRAAFERVASAVRAGDRSGYRAAGAAVERGERQLDEALSRLEAAGYRLVE